MVQLFVKTTAGKKFSVEIELERTVAECKTALVPTTEVPEAQQRLIFKGKVLKDEETLASYGTVNILLTSLQQQMLQNPEMMRQMMDSPIVQSIMSNPEIMRMSKSLFSTRPVVQVEQVAVRLQCRASLAQVLEAPLVKLEGRELQRLELTLPHLTQTLGRQDQLPPFANPWANPGAGAGMAGFGGLGGLGAGAPNPELLNQLLQSPLMQPMLDEMANNPQMFVSQMEQMNPQVAAMFNANPQMRQMMMNPDFIRGIMNPQNLQAMMQMQSAMNQLRSSGLIPGFEAMNLGAGMTPPTSTTPGNGTAAPLDFSALLGGLGAPGSMGAAASPAANPEEHMLEVQELLDASAADASAVREYLNTIDTDELDQLLAQLVNDECKRQARTDGAPNDHDWLALVQLLLQSKTTRGRTMTRLVQLLWRGVMMQR
ncbi:hypothetical protein P43SY_002582 [Pythium insidiosum]|uniref:Ubiquitin-like domain-containing protein n=1 Tax=Pythium insidiosum TaxID=114742 RepID=A0AAD5MCK9_PYTIN|nr:hypothetical protein P43SY_002582 [Pythium insidiosum]